MAGFRRSQRYSRFPSVILQLTDVRSADSFITVGVLITVFYLIRSKGEDPFAARERALATRGSRFQVQSLARFQVYLGKSDGVYSTIVNPQPSSNFEL
jgi:hypothetical protein